MSSVQSSTSAQVLLQNPYEVLRHYKYNIILTKMIENIFRPPPSDPSGATGKVCNWVYSIELKDIPEEIKTHTKYLILDGIACAVVGAQLPWSRTATKALLELEGPGDCTVFGWDQVCSSLVDFDALLCLLTATSVLAHSMQR